MNWLIAFWHKYSYGKNVPWAKIHIDEKTGFISISNWNQEYIKIISEKLPPDLISAMLDYEIVKIWEEMLQQFFQVILSISFKDL
jgi:hypothetical protein